MTYIETWWNPSILIQQSGTFPFFPYVPASLLFTTLPITAQAPGGRRGPRFGAEVITSAARLCSQAAAEVAADAGWASHMAWKDGSIWGKKAENAMFWWGGWIHSLSFCGLRFWWIQVLWSWWIRMFGGYFWCPSAADGGSLKCFEGIKTTSILYVQPSKEPTKRGKMNPLKT